MEEPIDQILVQATLDTLPEPLMVVDAWGRAVFANRAWKHLQWRLRASEEAVAELGQESSSEDLSREGSSRPGEGVPREPDTGVHGATYQAATYQAMCGESLSEEAVRGVQAVLDGVLSFYETSYVWPVDHGTCTLRLSVTPLGPGRQGAVFSYRDLTEQTRRETEIYKLANLDPLTGLLNRRLFSVEAGRVLDLAERHHQPFALLYLDLDGFKAVNDTNGHEVGDEALCEVALRLQGLVRESDLLARLGGDEFLILLPQTDERESLAAAERYLESFREPFYIRGVSITLKGSFGVANYPAHGRSIDDLVRLADEAMYEAKASGGGVRVHVPGADAHETVIRRMAGSELHR